MLGKYSLQKWQDESIPCRDRVLGGLKKNKRIIIIGAGPVGCYAASLLAKKGFDVEIYEEHPKIGRPVSCTGLVTKGILDIADIRKSFEKSLVNRINYAEIIAGKETKKGENRKIKAKIKVEDYIIDRAKFDEEIAKSAEKNGANLFLNHKFIGIDDDNLMLRNVKTKDIKKICRDSVKCVIAADGPGSIIAKLLNPGKKRRFYIGKQVLAKINHTRSSNKIFDKETFKVYLGDIYPKFFAWIVPEDENFARIGVGALKNINRHFDEIINLLKSEGYTLNIKETQAGLIPVYDADYKISGKIKGIRCYLVGDAAGHVKATTGGGIIPGLRCAKILANCIASEKKYEPKTVEKELKTHLFVRKILNRVSQKDYEDIIRMVGKQRVKKILSECDRDSIIQLLPKLIIAEPRLLKFGLKILF